MSDKSKAENDKSRLKAAKSKVKTEQSNAESERRAAKTNFNKDISLWKGKHFDEFKKDWSTLSDKYDDWISKWGWGDDGSINGVIDKMDHKIGSITAWLDSFFN